MTHAARIAVSLAAVSLVTDLKRLLLFEQRVILTSVPFQLT